LAADAVEKTASETMLGSGQVGPLGITDLHLRPVATPWRSMALAFRVFDEAFSQKYLLSKVDLTAAN
jgi:hypothetical protein